MRQTQSPTATDNTAPAADRHATDDTRPIDRAKEAEMANSEPIIQASDPQAAHEQTAPELTSAPLSEASPAAMTAAADALGQPSKPPEGTPGLLDLAATRIEPPARLRTRSRTGSLPNGPVEDIKIPKPDDNFNLDDFKSNVDTSGVGTLLGALSHHKLADAGDFVRLHPNEATHWTSELCFLSVPIVGQNRDALHLIKKEVAIRNQLPLGRLSFFRLALASKPFDQFFLCHVPSRNLDNTFNNDSVRGCQIAKERWVMAVSKRKEGKNEDGYKLTPALDQDVFLEPKWPKEGLRELINATFDENHRITTDDHPGLLRVLGKKQLLG
jgi:hypothetical protein